MEEDLRRNNQSEPDLAVHAYHLWEERGRPWGTPEIDWFRAEQELQSSQDIAHEPSVVSAAKAVGSVLGSVAGIVSSLTEAFDSH
jgi:hypothetical protein